MKEKQWSLAEIVLFCALLSVIFVSGYYFILLPQYWTLRDDYSFAIEWGQHRDLILQSAREYLRDIMSAGRFQPMDVLNRVFHYYVFSPSPRIFRITFFMSAGLALAGFYVFLKAFLRERVQILLALLLVFANHSFKEWLTTLTVSEAVATIFLIWALAFYSGDRYRWIALILYPLAFMAKESFVILGVVFAVIEYFRRRPQWTLLIGLFAEAVAFALFIHHLPRVYTLKFSLSNLAFGSLLKSFVLPPLKSFGPALLLLIFSTIRGPGSRALFWSGLSSIMTFTVFINMWGPFDSWYYLHTFIPFGWAMIFAATLSPPVFSSRVGIVILVCTFIFQLVSTVNGDRNYYDYFLQSRQAAELGCLAWERDKSIQVVSNCNEGASALTKYLQLEKKCSSEFKIKYVPTPFEGKKDALDPREKRAILYSRYCDDWKTLGFDLQGEMRDHKTLQFGAWTFIQP